MKKTLVAIFICCIIFGTILEPMSNFLKHEEKRDVLEKIEPAVFEALKVSETARVIIVFNSNADKNRILHKYALSGIDLWIINGFATVLSREQVLELAKEDAVSFIYLSKQIRLTFHQKIIDLPLQIPFNEKIDNNWRERLGINLLEGIGITGEGITVAVIDSGIDSSHPDLADAVIYEESFVDYNFDGVIDEDARDYVGHGTHVAGIIAGRGVASAGKIKGVASKAKLWNLKAFAKDGSSYDAWLIAAIQKAVESDDVSIISMSFGGIEYLYSPIYCAVERAWKEFGKIVVVAAGNEGMKFSITSPGIVHQVITVGAVDHDNKLAWFSSRGPNYDLSMKPDIVAPGVNIPSTYPGGIYAVLSGTSMATPVVSGVIALLLQVNPNLSNDEVKFLLMKTAIDLGYSPYEQGAGLVNPIGAYNSLVNEKLEYSSIYDTVYDPTIADENVNISRFGVILGNVSDEIPFFYSLFFVRVVVGGYSHIFSFLELKPISAYSYLGYDVAYALYVLQDPLNSVLITACYYIDMNSGFFFDFNIKLNGVSSCTIYAIFDVDIYDKVNDRAIVIDGSKIEVYDYIWPDFYFVLYAPQMEKVELKSFPDTLFFLESALYIVFLDALENTYNVSGDVGGIISFAFTSDTSFRITCGWDTTSSDAQTNAERVATWDIPSFTSYEISRIFIRGEDITVELKNLGEPVSGLTLKVFDIETGELLTQIEDISLDKSQAVNISFSVGAKNIRINLEPYDKIGDDNTYEIFMKTWDVKNVFYAPMEFSNPLSITYANHSIIIPLQLISKYNLTNASITFNGNGSAFVSIISKKVLSTGQVLITLNITIPANASGLYILNISVITDEMTDFHVFIMNIIGNIPFSMKITDVSFYESDYFCDDDWRIEEGESVDVSIDVEIKNELPDTISVLIIPKNAPLFTPDYEETFVFYTYETIYAYIVLMIQIPNEIDFTMYLFASYYDTEILVLIHQGMFSIEPRDKEGNVDFSCTFSLYSLFYDDYVIPDTMPLYAGDVLFLDYNITNIGTASAIYISIEVVIHNEIVAVDAISGIDPGDYYSMELIFQVPLFIGDSIEPIYFIVTFFDAGQGMYVYQVWKSKVKFRIIGFGLGIPRVSIKLTSVEESAFWSDGDDKFEKGELGNFNFEISLSAPLYYSSFVLVVMGREDVDADSIETLILPNGTNKLTLSCFGPEDSDTIKIFLEFSFVYFEERKGVMIPSTATIIYTTEYNYILGIAGQQPPLISILLGILIVIIIFAVILLIRRRKRRPRVAIYI